MVENSWANGPVQCHAPGGCKMLGAYIIKYKSANGITFSYGACEGHIDKMKLGYDNNICIGVKAVVVE